MTHASTAGRAVRAAVEPRPPVGRDRVGRTTCSPTSRLRSSDAAASRARVDACQPIDLHFGGHRARDRRLRRRDRRRPRAVRLRPDLDPPGARGRARASAGSRSTDIRHLLLSHIHLDHAGAAGPIVREHPELTVWVSRDRRAAPGRPVATRAFGAPALRRPVRPALGRARARAGGRTSASPSGDVLGWECFPTPGHASHHVSYFRDGTLLAGDAAGVRMPGARTSCPSRRRPTSTSRRGTRRSTAIRARDAGAPGADPLRRARGRRRAPRSARGGARPLGGARARRHGRQDEFVAAARADAGADADIYDRVAPLWQCWQGLKRYWDTRENPS